MKVYLSGVKGFVSKEGKRYVLLSTCDPEEQMFVNPKDNRVFSYGRETSDRKTFLPESMYDHIEQLLCHTKSVINLIFEEDFQGKKTLVDIDYLEGGEAK